MTDPTTPSTPEPTPPAASTPPVTPPASTPTSYSAPQATPPAYAPAYNATGPARYNTLSIVGFVLAFVVSLAGLIVSIIAYRQIGQTGEQGKGLALAGIIISAVGVFFGIIWFIFIIIGIAASAAHPYN